MTRTLLAFAGCLLALPVRADPIHPVADGAYWHHDSNWIFPERIGVFTRVGIPQDVAGSHDAVAYYAFVENDIRTVASVDVFPQDSATAPVTLAAAKAGLAEEHCSMDAKAETSFPLGDAGSFSATRVLCKRPPDAGFIALYFIGAGEWRVRILVTVPRGEADVAPLDAFVRAQRWDTLIPR